MDLTAMSKEEMIEFLKNVMGDKDKINEWNEAYGREFEWDDGPDLEDAELSGARLEGANLEGAHLEGANLSEAHLEGANLSEAHLEGACLNRAHLEGAKLSDARLEGAYLLEAHLEGAYLSEAHLEGAYLLEAHLEGANLMGAHLEGANLMGAHLEGANLWKAHLKGANLSDAHLEGAKLSEATLSNAYLRVEELRGWVRRWAPFFPERLSSIIPARWLKKLPERAVAFLSKPIALSPFDLDTCDVHRTNFWPNSSDSWSILRRTYTGPMMIFVLIFTLFAFAPYGAKAMLWAAFGRAEQALGDRGLLGDKQVDAIPGQWKLESTPVAWILLAPDQGWLMTGLGIVLLLYSGLRAWMTVWVGGMRDAEERSHVSPAKVDYLFAWDVHCRLSLVGYVSVLSGAWRVYGILSQEVQVLVPVG